jgi:hypothetical protein
MTDNTKLARELCNRYGIPCELGKGEPTIDGVPASEFTDEDFLKFFTGNFKDTVSKVKGEKNES